MEDNDNIGIEQNYLKQGSDKKNPDARVGKTYCVIPECPYEIGSRTLSHDEVLRLENLYLKERRPPRKNMYTIGGTTYCVISEYPDKKNF